MELDKIKLVIGLGNPQARYRRTYHNVGREFVDFLGNDKDWTKGGQLFSLAAISNFSGRRTIRLIKISLAMNLAGRAVKAALTSLNSNPDELLLVHDDSDLPLGSFRLSFGRGSAGHHGVVSVIDALGTNKFWRLRIGIRGEAGPAGNFVLEKIRPADLVALHGVWEAAAEKLIEKE